MLFTPEKTLETIVLESAKLRFVGNKAEFIDKNEVDAVLKQVAEQLLCNPGNRVYIASSVASATAGHDETFCLELSDARARAVKETLISHGVPEEQMISVGLGYVRDHFHVPDLNESGTEQIEEYARQNRVVRIVDVYSEDGEKITTYLE